TLSAVTNVGERPWRRLATKLGSPTVCRPNSLAFAPDIARNVSTLARNCSLIVLMIGAMKAIERDCVNQKK
ncbi:MAG: hypothetical protein NTZ05_15320, partial [Chloroflexi bacterium]|nr:hypothetical protein [Chloroflexota bacterium]